MWETLAIPVVLILALAVLLWFVTEARGKWFLKLALIIALPAMSIATWRSLDSYMGWPTPEKPPEKSLFLWGAVREPSLKNGDNGAIFVWLLPVRYEEQEKNDHKIFTYEPLTNEPRAYKLDYSRELHEKMEVAKELIKEGRSVLFGKLDGSPKIEDGETEGEGGIIGQQGGRGIGGNFADDSLMFYELPPSFMRPKGNPGE